MKKKIVHEINIQIGNRIRELRNTKKISQEKLAELADLHRTYIGKIERAEKNISVFKAHQIAKALDVTFSELFDISKNK